MKAMFVKAPGGLDRIEERDVKDPGAPGIGQLRVRMKASSLNFHDYGVVKGMMNLSTDRIPLADGSGLVEEVGPGVNDFKPGDHVVSCFFPTWQDGPALVSNFSTVPGDGVDGYAQEIVVAPVTSFTHAPIDYSFEESATITTAGVTVWRALVVNGQLRAGETVLTLGTGGVSILALQLAKAMGARVISTSSSNEKLKKLKDLGADEVINYKTHPEWGKLVLELTHGIGADHVIEVGGPGTLPQSIRAVRVGGHIPLIGVLTGRAGEVPTALLMAKQARLQGLIVGSRRHQEEYVRALETTKLRPIIDRTFPLREMAEAFRYQESGQHFGKVCLTY